MSKISDELRNWCDINWDGCAGGDYIDEDGFNELRELADRIDAEMAELPKDREGMPIHVGDTVWMADKGALELTVRSITLHACGEVNVDASCDGCHAHVGPSDLTHECSDSFERIADELERYTNDSCSEDEIDGATASTLVDFAERIRRLAKKEESNEPICRI